MSEPGWWILFLALVLLAAGAAGSVRFDVWTAWWHERMDPLWHRWHHH